MTTTRIALPRKIGGFAVVRQGEAQIDAAARSIARRIGGGAKLHHARETGRNVVGETVVSREFQLTFVYPEAKRGRGLPIAGEFFMVFREQ